MKDTVVILFSGHARNGKDTAAGFAKEYLESAGKKVMVYHFADTLKMICEQSYGWIKGDKGPVGRTILQNIGSNFRKNNKDCWANIANEIVKGTDADIVLIPDCRYKNEVEVFEPSNRFVVRIDRGSEFDNGLTEEQKNHVSENDMDDYPWDFIIMNTHTEESLKYMTEKVMKQII